MQCRKFAGTCPNPPVVVITDLSSHPHDQAPWCREHFVDAILAGARVIQEKLGMERIVDVPCFDPTCGCCEAWRILVEQHEDHIRALRAAGEDALTAMRDHDDMDLPTHPAHHEYGQLESAVQAVRHV